MATFNSAVTYTGENSAVKLPELDSISRSSQRAGQLAIKGEEIKLDKALKDKATFQKMLSIDPITAVSTKNAERQAIELEKYNNKWAERYVKNKGELSFADEMEMSKDRKMLEAIQGKMLADQKQYEAYKSTILRDTRGYYDKTNFEKAEQEYFNTGVLPQNMMDVAPQSMTSWLRSKSKEMPTTTIPRKDAMGRIIDEKVVDKADAQNVIFEGMQDEARLKDIVREFDAWSSNPANAREAYALLDRDKNGVVDPAENQYAHSNISMRENPIAIWAMNNPVYLESIMGQKEGASKSPASLNSRKATFDWAINVGSGHNRNNEFEIKKGYDIATTEGKVTLPDAYDFSGISRTTTDPRAIKTVLKPNGKGGYDEVKLEESARFDIISYSPTADIAVIELKSDSSDGSYDSGESLAVKGSDVNDLLQRKPFGIFRNTLKPTAQVAQSKKKAY